MFISSSFLMSIASVVSSIAHVGISCLPIYKVALQQRRSQCIEKYFSDDLLVRCNAEYPLTAALIRQELQSLGLGQVRVVPSKRDYVLQNDIAINYKRLEHVEKCLVQIQEAKKIGKSPEKNDLVSVIVFKGVLHHEAGHILNNDIKRFWLAAGAASFFTLALHECASRWCVEVSKDQNILRACLLKILHGIINGAIAMELFWTASRRFEYQADATVNDYDAVLGLISFLKCYDKQYREYIENRLLRWMCEHLFTHPPCASRADCLEKRLNEIKVNKESDFYHSLSV